MNNNIKKMAPLFETHLIKQINNSDTMNLNKELTSKPISYKKILGLYLKGLNLYDKNLSSFSNKWNNKKLILDIKKGAVSVGGDSVSTVDLSLNPLSLGNVNVGKEQDINTINNNNNNFNSNSMPIPLNLVRKSSNNTQKISKYIKSITIFNNKGKVITYNQNIGYNFGNNKIIKNIYTFLESSFYSMSSLISKPVFEITSEKVVIHLYYFLIKQDKKSNNNINNTFLKSNSKKLNLIVQILSRFFKKPVELELVRLYYPYFDSNILVNLFSIIINKIKVRNIMRKFFKKALIKNPTRLTRSNRTTLIPSFLSGIKIRIGGRLLTHRVVPRKTVKIIRRGALARGKVNFLDVARFTNKNKRGAFSITISTGQNFN